MTQATTQAAPAAAKAEPKASTAPKKRKYQVIGGKTWLRDAEGNEVKYVVGDVLELTAEEAEGRKGQVELYRPPAEE